MPIARLPDEAIAQIKSSATVISLNEVISELIKNSLDAGATKLNVTVDYSRGNCSVEDDGLGIEPTDFSEDGGLGKLHYTSRYPSDSALHGKHGTFIASLGSLSLLSITSHHHRHHSHNTIRIRNSHVIARHLPSLREQRFLNFTHGTRVTVRDLFGSMPVRVKQRAAFADKSIVVKAWDRLKHSITALLLAWPAQISVSLCDHQYQLNVSVKGGGKWSPSITGHHGDTQLIMRIPKLLAQVFPMDDIGPAAWIPVEASTHDLSIQGVICMTPVATKRIQFISIGIQPIPNEHGSNFLYEEVNRVFSNSSFGLEESSADIHGNNQATTSQSQSCEVPYAKQDLKVKKGVDRWPMFYVKISFQGRKLSKSILDMDDILDDRNLSLAGILDLLTLMTFEYLKKHHFRPRLAILRKGRNQSSSPLPQRSQSNKTSSRTPATQSGWQSAGSARSRLGDMDVTDVTPNTTNIRTRIGSPFDSWSRIKSGKGVGNDLLPREKHSIDDAPPDSPGLETSMCMPPLINAAGELARQPFIEQISERTARDQTSTQDRTSGLDHQRPGSAVCLLTWTNPITKRTSAIDPRTGLIVQPSEITPIVDDSASNETEMRKEKRMCLQQAPKASKTKSDWLEGVISSWENPVFENTEPTIPSIAGVTEIFERPSGGLDFSQQSQSSHTDTVTALGSSQFDKKISKQSLCKAEVIAQVDNKFILSKIPKPHGSGHLLLLIDQHAADERCRVESLMADYFTATSAGIESPSDVTPSGIEHAARTEILASPLRFEITSQELHLFEKALEFFRYWGIHYTVSSRGPVSKLHQKTHDLKLDVLSLPPSIVERCRLEPKLLIELLRHEVWKLDDTPGNQIRRSMGVAIDSSSATETADQHWLSRFHGCPESILAMINSRACRSAIMFNDVLTVEECRLLLRNLSHCALPFQCAHGRPSMVPLLNLENGLDEHLEPGHVNRSFGRQFKTWRK